MFQGKTCASCLTGFHGNCRPFTCVNCESLTHRKCSAGWASTGSEFRCVRCLNDMIKSEQKVSAQKIQRPNIPSESAPVRQELEDRHRKIPLSSAFEDDVHSPTASSSAPMISTKSVSSTQTLMPSHPPLNSDSSSDSEDTEDSSSSSEDEDQKSGAGKSGPETVINVPTEDFHYTSIFKELINAIKSNLLAFFFVMAVIVLAFFALLGIYVLFPYINRIGLLPASSPDIVQNSAILHPLRENPFRLVAQSGSVEKEIFSFPISHTPTPSLDLFIDRSTTTNSPGQNSSPVSLAEFNCTRFELMGLELRSVCVDNDLRICVLAPANVPTVPIQIVPAVTLPDGFQAVSEFLLRVCGDKRTFVISS